ANSAEKTDVDVEALGLRRRQIEMADHGGEPVREFPRPGQTASAGNGVCAEMTKNGVARFALKSQISQTALDPFGSGGGEGEPAGSSEQTRAPGAVWISAFRQDCQAGSEVCQAHRLEKQVIAWRAVPIEAPGGSVLQMLSCTDQGGISGKQGGR